ncbi:MAG: cyclodeaminase/cyclohydrolase family protein, partial [Nocardioidaceae bacterium]
MGGEGWATGDYLDRPLRDLLGDVSGADPVPAAGSLAAATGALAAGLVAKVARRSVSRLED